MCELLSTVATSLGYEMNDYSTVSSTSVPDPVVYFSFDDMTGITPHGPVNITIDEDRGKVLETSGTGGTGGYADLGNMSVACIARMDCTDGGTLMVWIKGSVRKYFLSTLTFPENKEFTGLMIGRNLYFYTSHGLYKFSKRRDTTAWIRITMVYNPESATDNSTIIKIFIDNQMYPIVPENSVNYPQGTGQMVVGRKYIDWDDAYRGTLIDDLKMWNHKLSDREIVAMSD